MANALQIMAQTKRMQMDNWHEDFFNNMSNKVFSEAGFSWQPGMAQISYSPVKGQGDVTQMWNQYSRAAKSRGLRPDYQRFMETFKAVKTGRGKKLLDNIGQIVNMYGTNKDFTKSLRSTLRNNPELRNDMMKAMQVNPDHASNSTLNNALMEIAADPNTVLARGGMEMIQSQNPLNMDDATLRAAGRAVGVAPGHFMAATKAGHGVGRAAMGAGLRAVVPGLSTASHLRGMGAFGKEMAKDAILADKYKGKGYGSLFKQNTRAATTLKNVGWRNAITQKGTIQNVLMKDTRALASQLGKMGKGAENAIKPKANGGLDWRNKNAKQKWFRGITSNLDKAINDLSDKKKFGKLNKAQRKLLKELNNTKSQLAKLNTGGLKKKAVTNFVKKGSLQASGDILNQAIKKVGWGKILRKAPWKLGSKIIASGVMKTLTPFTAGISGAVSLGMDAWMMADLYKLARDVMKEYGEQSGVKAQGGISQDISRKIAQFD